MSPLSLPALAAYVLIFIGLIGSVLPVVPGPMLILLGAGVWAWNDGFQAVGWPTLVILLVLALLAWISDLVLVTLFSRRMGVSWKAIAAAIAGGLIGGLVFGGWIPIIGTLVATIVGAIVGIVLLETIDKRDFRLALRASQATLVSYLVSSMLEASLAVLMVFLFVWQAFF
jgi:hypothetical protein